MPVTNGRAERPRKSPRNSDTFEDSDTVAASKPIYEANSYQDRIRQWQEQGASHALPPDEVSLLSPPQSDLGHRRPLSPDLDHEAQERDRTPKRRPDRRSRQVGQDREWISELRSASTPRKRVVSDEHWKSKRDEKEKSPQSAPRARRQDSDDLRVHTRSRDEREERRRKRQEAREFLRKNPGPADDGIRIYADPCVAPSDDGNGASGAVAGSAPAEDLAIRLESLSVVDNDDADREDHINQEGTQQRRPSKYAETLGRPPPAYAPAADLPRTKRGRLLSITKEMFGAKSESVPMVSNRLPSIEAWLDDQSDPFQDQIIEPEKPAATLTDPAVRGERSHPGQRGTSDTAASLESSLKRGEDLHTKIYALVTENPVESTGLGISGIDHDAQSPSVESDASPSQLRRRAARVRRLYSTHAVKDSLKESAAKHVDMDSSPPPPPPPPKPAAYSGVPRSARGIDRKSTTVAAQNLSGASNIDLPKEERPKLQRRLTTHEDLMSVLSLPKTGRRIRADRSLRKQKLRADQSSAQDVLKDLVKDETKYSRELRTLVDGIVPVLLQSVLSKTDSAATAGLFASAATTDDSGLTQQIIAMGIALERLKKLHFRIPLEDVDALLSWACSAHKAYADYLNSWKLGFQGVIVNLAPGEEDKGEDDHIMARDHSGDVVDANGKKVDVAYLLKRPLVRIKNLSKTFNAILAKYDVPLASEVVKTYDELTETARRKHQQEQRRLEDEEAYEIDTSKARDVRTLAAAPGKPISQTCTVKARDLFDLTMYHSSGQRLDCKVEIIMREESAATDGSGDLLICQIDDTARWLLFPPLLRSTVSARKDGDGCDLVIMVRGPAGINREWHELLALKAEHLDVATEWMGMLGSNPLPPRLPRKPSFVNRQKETLSPKIDLPPEIVEEVKEEIVQEAQASMVASTIVEPPLGEPSVITTKSRSKEGSSTQGSPKPRSSPQLSLGGGLQTPRLPEHLSSRANFIQRKPVAAPSVHSSDKSSISGQSTQTGSSYTVSNSSFVESTRQRGLQSPKAHQQLIVNDGSHHERKSPKEQHAARPAPPRKLSSTPSQALPTISKVRSPEFNPAFDSTPLNESIRDRWSTISGEPKQKDQSIQYSPVSSKVYTEDVPQPPSHRHNSAPTSPRSAERKDESPPPTPAHRAQSTSVAGFDKDQLKPQLKIEAKSIPQRKRSSPLKHEYAPSSASESSSGSSSDEDDADSDTSEDLRGEEEDKFTPLVSVRNGRRISSTNRPYPKSTGTRSIAPSDSASQGPHHKAQSPPNVPKEQRFRGIASVCSWSDRGCWEHLHPDECTIVVSPGLVEVFETSEYHTRGDASDGAAQKPDLQPLVAFELTPIVSLQGGTALDVNIRSPSTPNSKVKTSSTTMFRSRTVQEKENLYYAINWARCNNPIYIEMQRARPYRQPPVTFDTDPPHTRTKSGSWFSFGGSQQKSSYRASSAPDVSVGGASDASAVTSTSAFSMLKRFSVNSPFNLNRSSVLRKTGRGTAASIFSESSGTGHSGSSTPAPSQTGFIPGRDGPNAPLTSADAVNGAGMVNNMKIRLHVRKGQGWLDLRSGRLSVLPAPDTSQRDQQSKETSTQPEIVGRPGQSKGPRLPSSHFTPHQLHGNGREKRILVVDSKSPDVVKLDVVLGESCFERVMQCGIAMKVWQERNEIGAEGGVLMGSEKLYMLQFESAMQTSWVFGLVSNAGRYH